jgi:hypothetical protein
VFVSSRESDYAMFGGLRQLFFVSTAQFRLPSRSTPFFQKISQNA